jgi:hypothetical protein
MSTEPAKDEHSASRLCYACVLHAEVNGKDYTKRITLPFVPFVGLRIGDVEYNRDSHVVEEIVWALGENEFNVWCDPEEWESTEDEVLAEMKERCWVEA